MITNVFQIVHWRNHLIFPEEARLTPEAKDLICRLLCDVDHRLGTLGAYQIKVYFCIYSDMNTYILSVFFFSLTVTSLFFLASTNTDYYQAHPWFKDIVWDKLYEMEAAFKPEVNGELDTQNFMKFDEVSCCIWLFPTFSEDYRCCYIRLLSELSHFLYFMNFIW